MSAANPAGPKTQGPWHESLRPFGGDSPRYLGKVQSQAVGESSKDVVKLFGVAVDFAASSPSHDYALEDLQHGVKDYALEVSDSQVIKALVRPDSVGYVKYTIQAHKGKGIKHNKLKLLPGCDLVGAWVTGNQWGGRTVVCDCFAVLERPPMWYAHPHRIGVHAKEWGMFGGKAVNVGLALAQEGPDWRRPQTMEGVVQRAMTHSRTVAGCIGFGVNLDWGVQFYHEGALQEDGFLQEDKAPTTATATCGMSTSCSLPSPHYPPCFLAGLGHMDRSRRLGAGPEAAPRRSHQQEPRQPCRRHCGGGLGRAVRAL